MVTHDSSFCMGGTKKSPLLKLHEILLALESATASGARVAVYAEFTAFFMIYCTIPSQMRCVTTATVSPCRSADAEVVDVLITVADVTIVHLTRHLPSLLCSWANHLLSHTTRRGTALHAGPPGSELRPEKYFPTLATLNSTILAQPESSSALRLAGSLLTALLYGVAKVQEWIFMPRVRVLDWRVENTFGRCAEFVLAPLYLAPTQVTHEMVANWQWTKSSRNSNPINAASISRSDASQAINLLLSELNEHPAYGNATIPGALAFLRSMLDEVSCGGVQAVHS